MPSLIKSRFFPHTILIYLQYLLSLYILKFLICIHAGNPRMPPYCGGNNYLFQEQIQKAKKHIIILMGVLLDALLVITLVQ